MTETDTTVILVSGGPDSATALYEMMDRGVEPLFLHTIYSQRTETEEFECVRHLADIGDAGEILHAETEHLTRIGSWPLTDEKQDLVDAILKSDEIPRSYVPFGNTNLLLMATSFAKDRMRSRCSSAPSLRTS
jgi:7-cyano-7-deazaguanine synthase